MSAETEIARLRRSGRGTQPTVAADGGGPAFLGKVISTGANLAVGKFFLATPTRVFGAETEGALATITEATTPRTPVYLLGPGVPTTGEYLICRFVDYRWVAERGTNPGGGYGAQPGDCAAGNLDFRICGIRWGDIIPRSWEAVVQFGYGDCLRFPSTFNVNVVIAPVLPYNPAHGAIWKSPITEVVVGPTNPICPNYSPTSPTSIFFQLFITGCGTVVASSLTYSDIDGHNPYSGPFGGALSLVKCNLFAGSDMTIFWSGGSPSFYANLQA